MADIRFTWRIKDVAKETGLSSRDILFICYELNIYAKTAFSPLESEQVERIKTKATKLKEIRASQKGIKVTKLAMKLNVDTKRIIKMANQLNIPIKNGHSYMTSGQAERVQVRIKNSKGEL